MANKKENLPNALLDFFNSPTIPVNKASWDGEWKLSYESHLVSGSGDVKNRSGDERLYGSHLDSCSSIVKKTDRGNPLHHGSNKVSRSADVKKTDIDKQSFLDDALRDAEKSNNKELLHGIAQRFMLQDWKSMDEATQIEMWNKFVGIWTCFRKE